MFAPSIALKQTWTGLLMCLLMLLSSAAFAQTSSDAPIVRITPDKFTLTKVEGVTTRLVDTPQGKALEVTSTQTEKTIVLNLDWMEVKPATSYRTQFEFQPVSFEDSASVHLLVREHPQKKARPITPYQNTSVRLRPVSKDDMGKWLNRSLTFVTSDQTTQLTGSIILTPFKGTMRFTAFEVTQANAQDEKAKAEAAAWKDSTEMMEQIRKQADARKPLTPRPLVFSRAQMKYGLEKFYDHEWIDRPLFTSREYRIPHQHVAGLPSYRRILEEVVQYDIDGLAFFPETKGRMGMFEVHPQANMPEVGLLPEFIPKLSNEDPFPLKLEILKRALANPACPRINGKLLITSYAAEQFTPAQWKELLARLRAEVGDVFIFLPTVTSPVGLMRDYNAGKPLNPQEVVKIQANLREWLDACDGIYFNYPAAFRKADHTFNDGFYREVFIPVFKSVLSEPAYQNKYLGLSAYKSHVNPDRGNSLHEDATRTLRESFRAAMDAKPDVIILPEWDEFNENTCFRPTLYGSTTTQRILRYFMSQIKGKQPTPLHDDDTTLPNLIVSTRKIVMLGEYVLVELLNVPDTAQSRTYSVELSLHDEAGKLLKKFDAVAFDTASLGEHRLYLNTADYPHVQAITPSVVVRGYQDQPQRFEGFQNVQVRATWNWDYLFARQPVRELLQADKTTIAWDASSQKSVAAGQPLVFRATVEASEPIAHIELLGDDDLVYTYDESDEFHRGRADEQQILIDYRAVGTVKLDGTITLDNGRASKWIVPGTVLHQPETEYDIAKDHVRLKTPASLHSRWVYLSIPTQDIDTAVLKFDFEQARFSIPVKDIFEKKMISRSFEEGLHFAVSPYRRQIDMPVHLRKQQASFSVNVWPEYQTELYHLRVTSVSGKVWRSKPLLLPGADKLQGESSLVAQVDRTDKSIALKTQAARVPVIEYDFNPARGAVLLTDAGQPFWATLGGYTQTTTGRGTHAALLRTYPDKVERSAPQWVEDQGRPALAFDGVGTYLILPRETIPSRHGWTIRMEVKPEGDGDQVLLVTRVLGNRQTGIQLQIVGGKLQATFRTGAEKFVTDLAVPAGQWSEVVARYDMNQLKLSVNGKEEVFPLQGPALNIGFAIIGNDVRGQHFKGLLRALKIEHRP